MTTAPFTPETLKFLRGLARHNDREWFEARREVYERAVRAPLLRLIDEVNQGIEGFAPAMVRPATKTAMRIYRDTRFSPDKRPYKRHLGAWWSERGMERTTGAGFYFHLSATEIVFAAGVFMPTPAQLLAVRSWMAEHYKAYGQAVEAALAPANEPRFAVSEPEALRRVPKGFSAELAANPAAADLLRAKRWGVQLTAPAERALDGGFLADLVTWFRLASPVVLALAGAIREAPGSTGSSKKPLF